MSVYQLTFYSLINKLSTNHLRISFFHYTIFFFSKKLKVMFIWLGFIFILKYSSSSSKKVEGAFESMLGQKIKHILNILNRQLLKKYKCKIIFNINNNTKHITEI